MEKVLGKYSMGIGDRFSRQGRAQLGALSKARDLGVLVIPVWNKSHREHSIVGSVPGDVRKEADEAVAALGWRDAYHVDADHVGLKTVDRFIDACDFFTIDVADFVGGAHAKDSNPEAVGAFVESCSRYFGSLRIPGLPQPLSVTVEAARDAARKYLPAVEEAGRISRHIESVKGRGSFVAEVSMDEAAEPQTPLDLLFILLALARESIPVQSLAPKFTGRFNKGVDYCGEVSRFAMEFEQDLAVVAFGAREMGLPPSLKLSVHSGSDKFSIYPCMRRALRKFDAGLHLKTAGTTWLEELAGLAEGGGEGLRIAREVYASAYERYDEMCAPYAAVLDIRRDRLPLPAAVARWDSAAFAAALTHDQAVAAYNPDFRQLLHVSYKVAVEMGPRFLHALDEYAPVIAPRVGENIFARHLKPLFLDS